MRSKWLLLIVALGANDASWGAENTVNGDTRAKVEQSLSALLKSGPAFVKQSGCVSCHNNTLPLMATGLARQRGLKFDEESERAQLKATVGGLAGLRELLWETTDAVPDVQVSGPYILQGLFAQKYPADEQTAAMVHAIASRQLPDGSWASFINRAPLENGDIQATAMAVRAMQIYGMPGREAEWSRRTAKARAWLSKAVPVTTEDKIMLLNGLVWSRGKKEDVMRASGVLLAEQRADGGWAQLPTLESDAYATGKALVTLHESGILNGHDEVYRKGAAYLSGTQEPDGTWHVKARAFPFQPLKDSGFAHGRDQWISAAGTSWAAMALTYTLDAVITAKTE